MPRCRVMSSLVLGLLLAIPGARAATRPPVPLAPPRVAGFAACAQAIAAASLAAGLPPGLLRAVATVESGRTMRAPSIFRRDFAPPAPARRRPWPWTIDAGGVGRFFASRAAAIGAVRALRAKGVRRIDVGCLQVDLGDHPRAFASLRAAFDPAANARWAAGFLLRLHAALGSWRAAIAAYHSRTPALGRPYRRRVLARWRRGPAGAPPPIYADFLPRDRKYADFAPVR
ncbi:MAG: hypothetical protein ACP5NP_05815 [Acetobacteraceae bacterium]